MARRVVLIVLGALLLVIDTLAAIGGGALIALFGSNNTLTSGVQQVSTPTLRAGITGWLDSGRIRRTDRRWQRPVVHHGHAGRGRASALPGHRPSERGEQLSQRVSHDVATDVSVTPFHLTLGRQSGTATPPPPGSQSFAVAKASGSHPTLTWTVTNGSYRVVVMNTDAAAPVAFAGGLDLDYPLGTRGVERGRVPAGPDLMMMTS